MICLHEVPTDGWFCSMLLDSLFQNLLSSSKCIRASENFTMLLHQSIKCETTDIEINYLWKRVRCVIKLDENLTRDTTVLFKDFAADMLIFP